MATQATPPGHLVFRASRLGCAMLILVAALWPQLPTAIAQHRPKSDPVPTGQLVPIGGRSLFVQCAGSGSPLVILEHGLGGSSAEWSLVMSDVARETTVCAYDRAGEGQSDPDSGEPHSAGAASRDLEAMLTAMDIDEPIVLAGFSIGGLLARHFASTHPRSVSALVLIDSTPPEWTAMNISRSPIDRRIDTLLLFSGSHPSAAERLDLIKASAEVFFLDPPRVPVFMLTAGVKSLSPGLAGDERAKIATRLQNNQARELDARHELVAGCTHAMPASCPEAVINVVLQAVDNVRRQPESAPGMQQNALLPDQSASRRVEKRRPSSR